MKARYPLSAFLLTVCLFAAHAGDISTFVNLGFSTDSKNFMFGVYGVDAASLPHAEANIINVSKNVFQPGGQAELAGTQPVSLGQDGSGALYNILRKFQPQITRYKIDHLALGRLVYILVNGQEPKASLTFRDFNTDTAYEVEMRQSVRAGDKKNEAEFSICLTVSPKNASPKKYLIGRAGFFRPRVDGYLIRQIILSPDERSLIFVIEKQDRSQNALSTSYMVETVNLL